MLMSQKRLFGFARKDLNMYNVGIVYTYDRYINNIFFVEKLKKELEQYNIIAELEIIDNDFFYDTLKKYDLIIIRSVIPELIRFCRQNNISTVNSLKVHNIGNDKWETYKFAQKNNIETADTILINQKDYDEIDVYVGKGFIIAKSLDGHGGSEVFNIAKNNTKTFKALGKENIILQEMCDPGKDLRVYIVSNQVIVGMLRESKSDFRSNYKLGGSARKHILTAEENKIINKVLESSFFDFASIDLIYKKGKPILNEIEDIVGSRMVYENTNIDIIKIFAKWINKKLRSL